MSLPLQPLADRIVATREEAQTKTASGLYLPNNAKEKTTVATVQAVGKDVKTVKKGDRIVYKEDAPQEEESTIPTVEVVADEPVYPMSSPVVPTATGGLDDIKKSALEQLRPLVDKLDLPADEKFDTLLLIIRSTDDQSLVNAAYEAAKLIEDENKRAQALLDVIKEIDYFANQSK